MDFGIYCILLLSTDIDFAFAIEVVIHAFFLNLCERCMWTYQQ